MWGKVKLKVTQQVSKIVSLLPFSNKDTSSIVGKKNSYLVAVAIQGI